MAGGNREGCCLGGGTRDVRVGGALIIAFSDEVGGGILQEELATPLPRRGGQGPEGSNPLGICFVLASPSPPPPPSSCAWDGSCSVQRPLPASSSGIFFHLDVSSGKYKSVPKTIFFFFIT